MKSVLIGLAAVGVVFASGCSHDTRGRGMPMTPQMQQSYQDAQAKMVLTSPSLNDSEKATLVARIRGGQPLPPGWIPRAKQ